ncbi:hypothetical protein [Pseudomonas alkylphenolica]|uniref:hypothetical protein n=1 Tax=Pseudomonas alkylphenolica TaxID=237609 RepID=UPI00315CCF3E
MPTENRSSNTEQMVSVPLKLADSIERTWRQNGQWNMETNQEIARGVDELRALLAQRQGEPQPWMWALMGPDGKPHFDDFCVSSNPAHLECNEEGVTVVAVYRHPPVSDGASPEQMTSQGADGYRNGIKAAAELAADYPELAQAIRDLPLPQ